MKILFLSTSDIFGGAAISANRLFQTLKDRSDLQLNMLVERKLSSDPRVLRPSSSVAKLAGYLRGPVENLLLKRSYPKSQKSNFMAARIPDSLGRRIADLSPDLLHVHWVGQSFLRPETLSGLRCPIVWTLHDMWPLTGGCYYDGGCGRYVSDCGACPVLGGVCENDLSRKVLHRKRRAWQDLNLTLVAPSNWLAICARRSAIHQGRHVEVIPYGLDPAIFRPWPKSIVREMLNLPRDKKLVLFGSAGPSDPRKGFIYLEAALEKLNYGSDVELVVFGGHLESQRLCNIGLRIHLLGQLRDELTAALAYSAADVFVAPSLEDNLPNTVLESMMCATPVVAFRIGGIPEAIEHEEHGLLVTAKDSVGLEIAIRRLLEDDALRISLGRNARVKAEREYHKARQAQRYIELYKKIIA